MKKFLSLVLTLALVLGMATVAFAADYIGEPTKGDWYIEMPTDAVKLEKVIVMADGIVTADVTSEVSMQNLRVKLGWVNAGTEIYVDYTNTKNEVKQLVIEIPAKGPDAPEPDQYVIDQLKAAYDANATVAYFDLAALKTPGVLTATDVAYINNTWEAGWFEDYKAELGYKFLNLDLCFYWGNGDNAVAKSTTTFYISAADYDYTWTTGINFNETAGVKDYDQDPDVIYSAIRKMTGDVKQPYTFGFVQPTDKTLSTTVPTMTISKVIPQQWMNVYGHKNLSLSVYTHTESKCSECSAATGEHLHALTADITLDAATQTQRIEFVTNTMYKTLVLAKNAVAAPEAADKTDDANPNTGVNDMVNVAIVFAVVSLIAAGSFVFSKASR